MAYFYKKEFFRDWYAKNRREVKKEDLKVVLGTSSGNSLQYWLLERELPPLAAGKTDTGDRDWLPLRCILRLCNKYGLRLSDFIGNAEEPEPTAVKRRTKGETETVATVREAYREATEAMKTAHAETVAVLKDTVAALRETIEAQRLTIEALRHRQGTVREGVFPQEG